MMTIDELRTQADSMIQSLQTLLGDANARYVAAMGQLGLRDHKIAQLEAERAHREAPQKAPTQGQNPMPPNYLGAL